MSFLEVGKSNSGMGSLGKSIWESGAEGWGPFTFLTRKEERKSKKDVLKSQYAERGQTFEQQRTLAQEAARSKALEDLRDKVTAKILQLEAEADSATSVVLKVREVAASPILENDPIMEDFGKVMADMERAVITIQASTVVDVATFETDELAGAYSDAQAALLAMRTVTARAQGVLRALVERIQQIKDEAIRVQMLEAAAVEERAVQVRRQRQLEEQRRSAQADRDAEIEMRRRRDIMSRVMAVQAELNSEKRRLSAAKVELSNLRFAQSDRQARLQELRSRSLSGYRP